MSVATTRPIAAGPTSTARPGRRKPTILACLHQTANAKATAMQERNYANRAGSWGPSATAYIDRDGTIVRAIDPVKYAAWSQGVVAHPNTKLPTIAAAVRSGVNLNEWVHESIECSGSGTEPYTDAQFERPIPQEFSRAAHDAASIVAALMDTVCVHPRRWSPGFDWTVAVPVVVGTGIPVADDAPRATALRILFAGDDAAGLHVIEPGDVLQGVGGTNGRMLWPPATAVFEVLSGLLAGTRVQFVLDPDPRPAGESAVTAGEVLLRVDEPVLADAVRLADLHATISSAISPRSGA